MATEAQPRHWPHINDGMLRCSNSGCSPEHLRKEVPLLGAASPGSDCRPDRHWPLLRESGTRSCSSKPPSELLEVPAAPSVSPAASSLSLREPARWDCDVGSTDGLDQARGCQRSACTTLTRQQFPQPTLTECHSHGQGTERIAQQTRWPLSIQQDTSAVPPFISLSLRTAPDGCSSGATSLMISSSSLSLEDNSGQSGSASSPWLEPSSAVCACPRFHLTYVDCRGT